jgi:hypothetical protein
LPKSSLISIGASLIPGVIPETLSPLTKPAQEPALVRTIQTCSEDALGPVRALHAIVSLIIIHHPDPIETLFSSMSFTEKY